MGFFSPRAGLRRARVRAAQEAWRRVSAVRDIKNILRRGYEGTKLGLG